jgi:hypothetical protein
MLFCRVELSKLYLNMCWLCLGEIGLESYDWSKVRNLCYSKGAHWRHFLAQRPFFLIFFVKSIYSLRNLLILKSKSKQK